VVVSILPFNRDLAEKRVYGFSVAGRKKIQQLKSTPVKRLQRTPANRRSGGCGQLGRERFVDAVTGAQGSAAGVRRLRAT